MDKNAWHEDGESFMNNCNKCQCKNGNSRCTLVDCGKYGV